MLKATRKNLGKAIFPTDGKIRNKSGWVPCEIKYLNGELKKGLIRAGKFTNDLNAQLASYLQSPINGIKMTEMSGNDESIKFRGTMVPVSYTNDGPTMMFETTPEIVEAFVSEAKTTMKD